MIATTLGIIFGTAVTSANNSVWAATIQCSTSPVGNFCAGTNDDDRMLGPANQDAMAGGPGDDTMFGYARNDFMVGNAGDDTMSGGSGDDIMVEDDDDIFRPGNDNINGDSSDDTIAGGYGADILKGSSGNDKIYQWFAGPALVADGFKDTIDCGSGNDEARINVW